MFQFSIEILAIHIIVKGLLSMQDRWYSGGRGEQGATDGGMETRGTDDNKERDEDVCLRLQPAHCDVGDVPLYRRERPEWWRDGRRW